jgi:diguanylate cyclase (GGDEF)-like protein
MLKPLFNFALITLLLGATGVYINNVPEQQMEQGQSVAHTHDVLNQLTILSAQLEEARALRSEYIHMHAKNDYDHYKQTVSAIGHTISVIENLTSDNPHQQVRIPLLRQSIAEQIKHFTHDIENPDHAQKQTTADAITQLIENMRNEEELLLQKREEHWNAAMLQTRLLFLGGLGFLYLLILFSYIVMRKETQAREQLLEIERQAAVMQMGMATRMTRIAEIQRDIIYQRLDLTNAMNVITKHSQNVTRADGTVVEMLEGDETVYRAASGNMTTYIGLRIKTKGSMSGLCIESAKTLQCDDSETDDRVDKEACRKVGLRSMIVVPLMRGEQAVGVLKVASARTHAFTAEDFNTLQLLAGVLSATLRDAIDSDALTDFNKTLSRENELLQNQNTQLQTDATTDGMTGLKNHRYFQGSLAQGFYRAKRYGNDLSLIILDVDNFKRFNDRFGHPGGDAVLKQLALLLTNYARPSDCVARYGGEEFAIILTQTKLEGALKTTERICETIRGAVWPYAPITVSLGVSALENNAANAAALIEQADKALYQSKMRGRDRVTSFAA